MRNTRIIAIFTLFLGARAEALTTPIFSQDGKMATILLAGMPGDIDPSGFYNALKVAPEDFQGKWSKRLALPAPDGSKGFDIACVFSKLIQNSGTCTVIFREVPGLIEVQRSLGRARLWLCGAAAERFAQAFLVRGDGTVVFRSKDGRFNVSVARNRDVVTDFVMDWNGKGI